MTLLVSTVYFIAWFSLLAFFVTTAWLAWRWSKVHPQSKLSLTQRAIHVYTWPIIVVSAATWRSRPEAHVAKAARVSIALSVGAGAVLLAIAAVVHWL